MFRRLRHHPAPVVEALAPGTSSDLVKIPRAEQRRFLPVELAQSGEEDGTDRHIDPDAQRIGAADDFQQTLLCQLLDQHAVLRQQARVMQPDAVL